MSEPVIRLNGKDTLYRGSSSCTSEQFVKICNLAEFIFSMPTFLTLTGEIFTKCFSKEIFTQAFDDIIELNKDDYDSLLLNKYTDLVKDFYHSSNDVENHRGIVVEKLCELAITKKYGNIESSDIKFHCKVSIEYNDTVYSIDRHDIDVCGKIDAFGDYLEGKRGLTRDSRNDNKKMEKLGNLKYHFEIVNTSFGHQHILHVFTFTNVESKMIYYKESWPTIDFLSIDSFSSKFC